MRTNRIAKKIKDNKTLPQHAGYSCIGYGSPIVHLQTYLGLCSDDLYLYFETSGMDNNYSGCEGHSLYYVKDDLITQPQSNCDLKQYLVAADDELTVLRAQLREIQEKGRKLEEEIEALEKNKAIINNALRILYK